MLEKIKSGKNAFGFNAATEEFTDLVKAGIIDPTNHRGLRGLAGHLFALGLPATESSS